MIRRGPRRFSRVLCPLKSLIFSNIPQKNRSSIRLNNISSSSPIVFDRNSSNLSSSLLTKLFKTCNSCGIRLQDTDRTKPGFYVQSNHKPFQKPEDLVFDKHVKELSIEDQKLLTNDNEDLIDMIHKPIKHKSQSQIIEKELNLPTTIDCIRCREVTFKSQFLKRIDEFPVEQIETIMSNIPSNANLVYIINGQDFPLSIDENIFKFKSPNKIKFIINKSDLLFKTNSLALKYGLTFIQDYLKSKYQVPPENVMITSGKTNWNIKQILEFVDNNSYIIGHTNSGKSTIIKSLLYYIHKNQLNKKRLSSRDKLKLQKQQDDIINQKSIGEYKMTRLKRKNEELIKNMVGPGASFMPGFTRGFIEIVLGDEYDSKAKVIYDVPGFSNDLGPKILNQLDPKKLKNISKGSKVFDSGFYYSHYETIKGNQCLTFGGLMYIIPPSDSMYQIRSCINYDYDIYKNFEHVKHIATSLNEYPSLIDKFLVNYSPEEFDDNIKRFIVPPHYGSIDLVFQNLGHINLKPTGPKQNSLPMIIYLPRGLKAIIRQPITDYIAKSFSGKDGNRNRLRKENYLTKSTFELKRYNNKQPFYSQLIPSEKIFDDESQQMELDYKKITEFTSKFNQGDLKYDSQTILDEQNKFDYWIEN